MFLAERMKFREPAHKLILKYTARGSTVEVGLKPVVTDEYEPEVQFGDGALDKEVKYDRHFQFQVHTQSHERIVRLHKNQFVFEN